MFLAPEIYSIVKYDYESNQLNTRESILDKQLNNYKKNVHEPKSEYHYWLENNGKTLDRKKIIQSLEEEKTNLTENKDLNPSTVSSVTTPSLNTTVISLTDREIAQCFVKLAHLNWRDISEQKMTIMNVNLSKNDLITLIPRLKYLANNLREKINIVSGALESMNEEHVLNFLFHVLTKGYVIYSASIDDPNFCLYLLDEYQDLYTFMLQKIR